MLIICTSYCSECDAKTLLAISSLSSPPPSWRSSGLDILLEFFNAEVTVLVQSGERLPHPQGCEAGCGALVPALLHDLHNGRENLDT